MEKIQQNFLESLPYPLLPPQRKGRDQVFFGYFASEAIAQPVRHHLSDEESSQHAFDLCLEQIVVLDPEEIGSSEARYLAHDNGLHHIFGHLYCTADARLTPLLKVAALYTTLATPYLERARVSRQTAAWVWGYLPQLRRPLHLDFDRRLRLNVSRAKLHNVISHQVRVLAYDYIQLGKVRVTTPLRTALDLLVYDPSDEADSIITAALNDTRGSCTPQFLMDSLDRMPYLRKKEDARHRLERLSLQLPDYPI